MANEIDGKLYIVRRALPGSGAEHGDPRLVQLRRFGAAEGGAHPLIVPPARLGSPPADGDGDLIEVDVTGAPKLQWDEAADLFAFTHGLRARHIRPTTDPTGTPDANTLYKGLIPKAWCNFNGTGTIAFRDQFNCSGLVDNGVGTYQVLIDRDMADANYCVATAIQASGTANTDTFIDAMTDSAVYVGAHNNSTRFDPSVYCVLLFGRQT